jgi:hypothetical protein
MTEENSGQEDQEDQQYAEFGRIDILRYGEGEIYHQWSVDFPLGGIIGEHNVHMASIKSRKIPDTKQRRMSDRARRDLTHGKQKRNFVGGSFCCLRELSESPRLRCRR